MVEVLSHPAGGKGQGEQSGKAGGERDVGSELKQEAIGRSGRDVFLGEQLDSIGQRLQPAELSTHARGSQAILNAAGNFTLQPNKEQRSRGRHEN